MLTKDAIQFAMQTADQSVLSLIDDMQNAPLTPPTPNGGNHPLWILGHLTLVEGLIPQVLYKEPNPVEEWTRLFGPSTEPVADAGLYPPFAEVRAKYDELFQANLRVFQSLRADDLDMPTKTQPSGLEEFFATYGLSFLTVALHKMSHRGQVADARRAAGRKPLVA